MELVLHIGIHKTGTTAIQNSLYGYDDGRARYARLGPANHSIPLATMFGRDPYKIGAYRRSGASKARIDRLKQTFFRRFERELSHDREALIVSGEGIHSLSASALTGLRDFAAPYAGGIRLIAYVREILPYCASALQERIKNGGPNHKPGVPDFQSRFQNVFDTFGQDAVAFSSFDDCLARDGSVLPDFADRAGLKRMPDEARQGNERLSLDATRLVYVFNQSGTRSAGRVELMFARQRMVDFLRRQFPQGKFVLPADIVWSHISAEQENQLRWLETASGISLLGAREAAPASGQPRYDAYMRDVSDETRARLLEGMDRHKIAHTGSGDVESLLQTVFSHYLSGKLSYYARRVIGGVRFRLGYR